MNKLDYKAIAGIMKIAGVNQSNREYVSKKLADFFDREDDDYCFRNQKDWKEKRFNRKDFLKECGVK